MMRISSYFLPVLKEIPSAAQIVSHRLMLRAGMVRQSAAGIYSWLPLGFRVLKNIERIVREEQDATGAQELLMPRSEEHTSELQSLMRISYAVFCLKKKKKHKTNKNKKLKMQPNSREPI